MKKTTRISISTCVLGFALGVVPVWANSVDSVDSSSITQDGTQLMMVLNANTPLRCGDQDVFYAITELGANTPLQAVGSSGAYTKVLLPNTIGAFVPATEVDAAPGTKSVTLKVDSNLRAPSHLLGLAGSWKALFATQLTSGTSLEVIETLLSDSGVILGYRVIAPKGPAGELAIAFVKTNALRDATANELSAFEANNGIIPVVAQPEPEPEPSTDSSPEQVDAVDSSMIEEMDLPSDDSTPITSDPVEIENTAPVEVDTSSESTQRTAPSGRVSASALEDLEAAFDNARSLSKSDLDQALGELFAEFTRTRADAEEGSSLARALDQRLEWLDIRIQTRDQRHAIAMTLAAYDAHADQVAKDIQAWQSGRAYQLVGRMVTSAVYTGEHLPLLYRIQATDPATGANRTIGYVAPNADQDFRHLLGRVVGVVGATNHDQSLKLTVIEPDRIDPMPE